jgi:HAD superfamily hydrolase (TIGR01509 family)
MDGVIVDSNPYHKRALQQFCKKYGQHLSEEQLREKIYGRRNQDWLTNVFGKLDPDKLKKYADEKEALFRELYESDIKPVTGLPEFLKKMDQQGVPRAIATSAPAENVTFTLQKTQTGPFFKTILDDSFVTRGKPDPEIYIKTAKALNFEPKNCVVFEDSLAGVQSAKSAGCKVVGLTTTHSRDELSGTDLIIDNFVGHDPQKMISELFDGKS